MIFLALVAMGVRVFTNRCGTSPNWVGAIAVLTIVASLTAWLVADGPLYDKVKVMLARNIQGCLAILFLSACKPLECVFVLPEGFVGRVCWKGYG